ncbi:isoprenoid synthase domain-containing protein [Mycena rebaudengoi]|nr:isoprenoid synthase domain-containing protein [Mycena rebaudengoi]
MPTTFTLPDFLAIFQPENGPPNLNLNSNFPEANTAFYSWYQTKAPEWSSELHEASIEFCVRDTKNFSNGDFDIDTLCPMDGPAVEMAAKSQEPCVRVMAEFRPVSQIVRTVTSKIPGPYLNAVIRNTKDLAQAMMDESIVRRTKHTTIEAFISHRQVSIGMLAPFDLMRYAAGVLLGDEILASDSVRSMTLAAAELIAITNDVCSYKKEVRDDEALHNLLTVCMLDPSTGVALGDIPAAVNFAEAQTRKAMHYFLQAKGLAIQQWAGFSQSLFKDEDIDNKEHILLYADVLLEAVVGNYVWHVDPRSKRYSVFPDEESRRTRTVTIPKMYGFSARVRFCEKLHAFALGRPVKW